MPYTPDSPDLPANVKKMTNRQRRQWCDIFNSVYKSCSKAGRDGCDGEAMRQANGVLKKQMESSPMVKPVIAEASKNPDDFLVVDDEEKPTTWHLQVKTNGKPDHRLMGAAWAALMNPNGYRGNKYEGPSKSAAISKLKALYKSEDMPTPKETAESAVETQEIASECGPYDQATPMVPGGVTSFADLQAAQDVYSATQVMNIHVQEFQQLAWNIFYSQDITDKIGALRSLVDEFAALMGDATSSIAGAELSEAATIKARAKSAINSLTALLTDKTLPKDLGEKIESLRSALRQNWKDLETLANDEKDDTEESVGEKLYESWEGSPVSIRENLNPGALLTMNVGLIKAGWGNTKDNNFYSREMLTRCAEKFVGAKMHEVDHREAQRSNENWVSTVSRIVGMADDGTLIAEVDVHDPDFAQRVLNLNVKPELLHKLECSILAEGNAGPKVTENGRTGKSIAEITYVNFIDWVTRAGAGGRALSLAESDSAQNAPEIHGDSIMEEKPKVEVVPETTPAPVAETVPVVPNAVAVTITETQPPAAESVSSSLPAAPVSLLEAAVVCETLAASSLPKTAQARLGARNYSTADELATAILAEKEYIKVILGAGRPHDSGVTSPAAPAKKTLAETQAEIDRRYGLGG